MKWINNQAKEQWASWANKNAMHMYPSKSVNTFALQADVGLCRRSSGSPHHNPPGLHQLPHSYWVPQKVLKGQFGRHNGQWLISRGAYFVQVWLYKWGFVCANLCQCVCMCLMLCVSVYYALFIGGVGVFSCCVVFVCTFVLSECVCFFHCVLCLNKCIQLLFIIIL